MSLAETYADVDAGFVDLLDIFGQSVTLQRRSAGTYNTTTGAPATTDTGTALTAVVEDAQGVQMVNGDTRTVLRFNFRMTDLSGTPVAMEDYIVYGGANYEVFNVAVPTPGAVQYADARLT